MCNEISILLPGEETTNVWLEEVNDDVYKASTQK